jgi:hypothetical protein
MNVFQVINPESIVKGRQLLINIRLISRTSINPPFLRLHLIIQNIVYHSFQIQTKMKHLIEFFWY